MPGSQRIAGITIEIGGNTKKLQDSLKAVDKQLSTSKSNLYDINKLLKLDPGNVTLLSQKQKELEESISATKDRLKELKSVQKDSVNPEEWDQIQREIISTEKKLEGLEKEYKNFGSVAAQQIKAVGEKMKNVGQTIGDIGKTLSTRITAPIAAAFGGAVKATADFDAQMSKVASISGAVGEEFDQLRAKAREMGAKTKFSATEAGQAFEYMSMAGWKTGDMLDGIEGIMNLAAASGEDLATTSDIVTDALTAFGLKADDSAHFADVLAQASSNANTNVGLMGETFKYVAPVAGALGYSAEDVAVAVGLMANSGIKASNAGTALRGLFTRLVKPTKQSYEAMQQLGISITEADGSMKPLSKLMIELRKRFSKLSDAQKAQYAASLAGQNGMSGLLAIVNASEKDFNDLTKSIQNADGAAGRMAERAQDNLAGQITILKSQLEELGIAIGDILMPYVRSFVGWVQQLVDKFNALSPTVKRIVVVVGAIAAAIGPLLVGVGGLMKVVGTAMTAAPAILGVVTKIAAVFTGPAGIAVAIGAAVVAVLKFTGVLDLIWEKAQEAFAKAKEVVANGVEAFKNQFGFIIEAVQSAIDSVKFALRNGLDFTSFLANLLTGGRVTYVANMGFDRFVKKFVGPAIKNALNAIFGDTSLAEPITNGIQALGDFLIDAWDTVKGFFTETLPNAIADVGTAFTTFKDEHLVPVATFLKDTFWKVWNELKIFFSITIPNAITSMKQKFDTFKANVLEPVATFLGDTFTNAWHGVKTLFTETIPNAVVNLRDGLKAFWEELLVPLGTFIGETFLAAWQHLKDYWTNDLSPRLINLRNSFNIFRERVLVPIAEFLTTTFSAAWEGIKTLFGGEDGVETETKTLKQTFRDLWVRLKPIARWVTNTLGTAWKGLEDVMSGLVTFLTGVFAGDWELAWQGLVDMISAPFNALKEILKTPINAVIDLMNGLIVKVRDGINQIINGINNILKIDIPAFGEWVFGHYIGFPGFKWEPGLPTLTWPDEPIPKLANGGVVENGGRAIVGEYAPEYLRVVNGRAVVTPMGGEKSWRMGGGGQTINNNITIHQQPGESAEQLASRVQRVLVRWENQRRAAFGQ